MDEKQRVRSPRHPSISLREAEDAARKIYSKDGMNPVDRESAVQHLGYSSLNGASATALASLKQYGLVTDSGKGMLRLSELALDLLEPESDEGRAVALKTAAFSPDLFAALRERFPDSVPSESNLRAHLIRQQFTVTAVKAVVPAYLETCEYVRSEKAVESVDSVGSSEKEGTKSSAQENALSSDPGTSGVTHLLAPNSPKRSNRRMIFDVQEGEVEFTYPENLAADSVDDIEEWFALVVKRLRRSTKQ